jgi:endonuclease/exonuclease/phosphatase family metal-dependent hydrolase
MTAAAVVVSRAAAAQLAVVWLPTLVMPVLVLGDFNEPASTPLFQGFIQALGAQSLYDSHPPRDGRESWAGGYGDACDDRDAELLDYILLIPQAGAPALGFVDGAIVQPESPYPSDHCPVWAELTDGRETTGD